MPEPTLGSFFGGFSQGLGEAAQNLPFLFLRQQENQQQLLQLLDQRKYERELQEKQFLAEMFQFEIQGYREDAQLNLAAALKPEQQVKVADELNLNIAKTRAKYAKKLPLLSDVDIPKFNISRFLGPGAKANQPPQEEGPKRDFKSKGGVFSFLVPKSETRQAMDRRKAEEHVLRIAAESLGDEQSYENQIFLEPGGQISHDPEVYTAIGQIENITGIELTVSNIPRLAKKLAKQTDIAEERWVELLTRADKYFRGGFTFPSLKTPEDIYNVGK